MSLEYQIVTADESHLPCLAANMRKADRAEVWASHRNLPREALLSSLRASERAWVAIVDGAPVAIWGVARDGCVFSNCGMPWMLATDTLQRYWVEFLRQSRKQVAQMMVGFQRLENFVHGENKLSIKWLRWCGFAIDREPVVTNGERFYRFWRVANV